MRFSHLRRSWSDFRNAPPGHRFRTHHRSRANRGPKRSRVFARFLAITGAVFCLLIAIPLIILPGPAVLFFALAGLLLAGESRFMAALCDYFELLGRNSIRRWQRRKQPRLVEPI